LVATDLDTLTALLETTSRRHVGRAQAERFHQAARASFGVTTGLDAACLSLQLPLEQMALFDTHIAQIDARLAEPMEEQALILTLPGIGPTLGAFGRHLIDEFDDTEAFGQIEKCHNGPKFQHNTILGRLPFGRSFQGGRNMFGTPEVLLAHDTRFAVHPGRLDEVVISLALLLLFDDGGHEITASAVG
jgi:hypothetical protein